MGTNRSAVFSGTAKTQHRHFSTAFLEVLNPFLAEFQKVPNWHLLQLVTRRRCQIGTSVCAFCVPHMQHVFWLFIMLLTTPTVVFLSCVRSNNCATIKCNKTKTTTQTTNQQSTTPEGNDNNKPNEDDNNRKQKHGTNTRVTPGLTMKNVNSSRFKG
jgi:hypothetical protein